MSLQRKLDSMTFDSKKAHVSLLLIFAAVLWLFDVSEWSFFVLLAVCRLLPFRVAVGVIALFVYAILPMDRLFPAAECLPTHVLGLEETKSYSQERCEFEDQVFNLTNANGMDVEVEGWIRDGAFTFPPAASMFDAEFMGTAAYTVDKDGRATVQELTDATASNVKPLFEAAIAAYIEEGFFFKTDAISDADYPLTGETKLRFEIRGEKTGFRFPTFGIVLHLAFLIIAGLLCGNIKTLKLFAAVVSVPYGVYIAALYSYVAIKSALTTKYVFLADALILGSFFVLLGALAWISLDSETQSSNASTSSVPRRLFAIASLVVLPIVTFTQSTDARFLAFLFLDTPTIDTWSTTLGDNFFWQQELLSYILQIFATWQFLCAVVLYSFIAVLTLRRDWRFRTADFYLLVSSALVVCSIIYWFASIDKISEDYTAIFIALEVGALALMLCPVALITDSLAPKLEQQNAFVFRGRRNLLLVELFTFFLFFAYAPISISELGQNFETSIGADKEQKDINSRLQRIEEKLDINNEEAGK